MMNRKRLFIAVVLSAVIAFSGFARSEMMISYTERFLESNETTLYTQEAVAETGFRFMLFPGEDERFGFAAGASFGLTGIFSDYSTSLWVGPAVNFNITQRFSIQLISGFEYIFSPITYDWNVLGPSQYEFFDQTKTYTYAWTNTINIKIETPAYFGFDFGLNYTIGAIRSNRTQTVTQGYTPNDHYETLTSGLSEFNLRTGYGFYAGLSFNF